MGQNIAAPATVKQRIGDQAAKQAGVLHWRQLIALGAPSATITYWCRCGYLHRVLPRVYAVGYVEQTRDAKLWAAVLSAGPGAALSHCTAGHVLGIVDLEPALIEVSTPRDLSSPPGLRIYSRRPLERVSFRGLPVTRLEQTVLDIAASASERVLRRALSRLDYQHRLDVDALNAICHHGARGSEALLAALEIHQPESAHTNGCFEDDFLQGCVNSGIPIPRFNVWVAGVQTDAYWAEHKLVVELDGGDNHSSIGQVRRDRKNDWKLRRAGLTVIRYAWDQVHGEQPPAFVELAEWFGV